MSRLYYVYRHLCPDGTAYIGVTTNPKRRWEANGCNYCDHPIFRNAIEKFGWKSIEHKILFTCLDKETARIKEKKIALYYQYYGLSLNAGNGHSHSPTKENRKKYPKRERELKCLIRQRIRLDKPIKKEQEQNTSKIELSYEDVDSKKFR